MNEHPQSVHVPFSMGCRLAVLLAMAAGCGRSGEQAVEPLLAGAARAIVTPEVEPIEDLDDDCVQDRDEWFSDLDGDGEWDPVWLAGFGANRCALGVHDDLFARVLVLGRGELRVCIVSVDWVGLLYDHALELRQAVERAGVRLDHLVISSTHNHEGPDTVGIWGRIGSTGLDEAYLSWAVDRIVEAVAEAVSSLAPVRIRAGVDQTEGLTDDSRLPEVLHEQVTALRFDRADGSGTVATVVHWSNHPEVLGGSNRLVTADFPGSLVDELELAASGSVGVYWQGMLGGLLTPMEVEVRDEQGEILPDYSFEKADRLGRLVARVALEALEAGEDITSESRLAFRRRELLVPFDNDEILLAIMAGFIKRTLYDAEGRVMSPGDFFFEQAYARTEVTVLDVGQAQIATVPGELYPELALEGPNGETFYEDPQDPGADFQGVECAQPIYRFMRDTPYRIILGLANDEAGYIIPKCQFDIEPPFAYDRDSPQYGERVSPGPDAAPVLNQALAEELVALDAQANSSID